MSYDYARERFDAENDALRAVVASSTRQVPHAARRNRPAGAAVSRDIDPELVEKAARIIDPADAYAGRGRARAVLAAVLPDVRRASVVDRDALRRVMESALGCREGSMIQDGPDEQPYALCDSLAHVETFHMGSCEFVDRLIGDVLAAGVVRDAADVRREVAEDVVEALEALYDERMADAVAHRDLAERKRKDGKLRGHQTHLSTALAFKHKAIGISEAADRVRSIAREAGERDGS